LFQGPCAIIVDKRPATDRAWMLKQVQHDDVLPSARHITQKRNPSAPPRLRANHSLLLATARAI
jgi:hypothetical protein